MDVVPSSAGRSVNSTLSPRATTAVRVEDLSVSYGDVVAVHEASFSVDEGECVAITGPNGNGKSSLIMGIVGLVYRRGTVEIFGQRSPVGDAGWSSRHGFTLVPERRQLYPKLTTRDNVLLGCYSWTRSLRKARRSEPYLQALELFPELGPHLEQRAGTLSGGQQQMVAIARGLASAPKILAVDEPCLGLAEVVARRVYQSLEAVRDRGTTLVIVEEVPQRALQIATREVQVRNGVVTAR